MKRPFKLMILSWTLIIVWGSLWISNTLKADEQDHYYQLKQSWVQMQRVYESLNLHYVEEIDPYPLVKAGIEGMLEKLDPYTVFIDEDGERRLRIITTGKYGGLGMEIGLRNKKITVISPMDDSPAKRAGILAGDVIEKIDGQNVDNLSIDDVSKKLRGEIGTSVKLQLRRPGLDKTFELVLERAEIVIKDVGYTGFVQPGIGYISLNGFTEKAASEVRKAIQSLKDGGKIEALILDLRGNPGGLLESAVEIVNLFVDKDELVVYTKGYNEQEVKFKTERNPVLPDVPLAVLVNEGSASASEIVAGALQDLDRAVIVGDETFGKGLVQKVFTVDRNSDSRIKITTAKYYIPSGRCIQKKDYISNNVLLKNGNNHTEENGTALKYFTRNHREVYDKGGIYPDIYVEGDSVDYLTVELIRQNMFFDFAVHFHQEHPSWEGEFKLDENILEPFRAFLDDRDFTYDIEGTREIENLETIAQKRGYDPQISRLIGEIREHLETQKSIEIRNNTERIRRLILQELAEKYFGKNGRDKYALETDDQVTEAARILLNSQEYNKVLSVK